MINGSSLGLEVMKVLDSLLIPVDSTQIVLKMDYLPDKGDNLVQNEPISTTFSFLFLLKNKKQE